MNDGDFGRNASRFLGKSPVKVMKAADASSSGLYKEWTCPECDTQNPGSASKCSECGTKAGSFDPSKKGKDENAEPQPNNQPSVVKDDEEDLIPAKDAKAKDDEPPALRWSEFSKGGQVVNKQKEFPDEAAREKFANSLENKDNFKEILAWSR